MESGQNAKPFCDGSTNDVGLVWTWSGYKITISSGLKEGWGLVSFVNTTSNEELTGYGRAKRTKTRGPASYSIGSRGSLLSDQLNCPAFQKERFEGGWRIPFFAARYKNPGRKWCRMRQAGWPTR